MERRELIKLVTMATGAALTVPLTSSILTACNKITPVKNSDYSLQYFKSEDFSSVQNLLNFILPKSDSPSAIDVGVHQTIDSMLGTVYSPDQKERFSVSFNALKKYGTSQSQLEQLKIVLSSSDEKYQIVKSAFLELKQQAVAYYLSTEEIATKYLKV